MKAQGTVKGILFEASDGAEYLLGFSRAQLAPTPILSRRQADGTFSAGKSLFLWTAFKEALKTFPPVPTWPTWSQ
jgi:hypothetical protein